MPVGYVATNNSAQFVDVVLMQDVQYAGWGYSEVGGNFGLAGIFYDEMKATDVDHGYINMIDLAVKVGQAFSPTHTVSLYPHWITFHCRHRTELYIPGDSQRWQYTRLCSV
jgi:hypothetical protein